MTKTQKILPQLFAILLILLSSSTFAQITVTNTNDAGPGSLRQAIIDADVSASQETIDFNIAGGGPWVIALTTTDLPDLTNTNGMIIDGTTQPGYTFGDEDAMITIDGGGLGYILNIQAPNVEVYGLVMINGGFQGIYLGFSANTGNIIGAPGKGNVISANGNGGILIGGSQNAVIQSNYIGTSVDGLSGNGNIDNYGIYITAASNITIGGDQTAGEGNVISANGFTGADYGIRIGAGVNGLDILGNYIGTDATGEVAIPNYNHGVFIENGTNINIGGIGTGEGNVISGNGNSSVDFGIRINGGSNVKVRNNIIGLNAAGIAPLPNSDAGIYLNASGSGMEFTDNTISASPSVGMSISTIGNELIITGNKIGTDIYGNGGVGLGNLSSGISLSSSSGLSLINPIYIANNIISGNGTGGFGHGITEFGSSFVVIESNIIGVDIDGTTASGNNNHGISLTTGTNFQIGGSGVENVIGYNGQSGIYTTGTSFGSQDVSVNNYFCNANFGIDIASATPLVLAPVITSITSSTISGTSSEADGSVIEIYEIKSSCADNQGATHIGSTTVSSGTWSLNTSHSPVAHVATVSDVTNGISEFSAAVEATPIIVTNINDSGAGSLRQAIIDANASTGEIIDFNIGGGGPWNIDLATELPNITKPTLIRGTSQPSWDFSTENMVTINISSILNGDGFNILSANVTIAGMKIINAQFGIVINGEAFDDILIEDNIINLNVGTAINIANGDNITIQGNHIGVSGDGLTNQATSGTGIAASGSDNIVIGGDRSLGDGNMIAGSAFSSYLINIANSDLAAIHGNILGASTNGSDITVSRGVVINNTDNITIGTSDNNFRNYFNGTDDGSALSISNADGVDVINNYIGIGILDTHLIGNNSGGATTDGLSLSTITNFSVDGNVISGSINDGIQLGGTTNTGTVINNIIGLAPDATTAFGNTVYGIHISVASQTVTNVNIGGIGNENIIAYNDAGIRTALTSFGTIDVQQNSIFCNTNLGIDISGTPLVDVPIITTANSTTISGTSSESDGARIKVYETNSSCADNQGATYVGQTTVTSGLWSLSGTFNTSMSFVATASTLASGSSEFSASFTPVSFVVTNTNDSGIGSLRAAVTNANVSTSKETITFNIPGAGPWQIDLQSTITIDNSNDVGMIIDGLTQPISAFGGAMITLDGTAFSGTSLSIIEPNVEIYGLYITNFTGHGLDAGTGSTDLIIGAPGRGNIISGNSANGIDIDGSTNAIIQGNRIGTTPDGLAAGGNQAYGIQARFADNILIGGNSLAGEGNLISGNGTANHYAIHLRDGTDAQVFGNLIGTDANGDNDLGNRGGINVTSGCDNPTIGGFGAGQANVVVGCTQNPAILVSASAGPANQNVVIENNIMGLNAAGTTAIPNFSNGISLVSVNGVTSGNIIRGNTIAASGSTALEVIGFSQTNIIIENNKIGTDASGNGGASFAISSAGMALNNVIGTDNSTNRVQILGNVITNAGLNGLSLANLDNALIQRNYIGVESDGTTPGPNTGAGITTGSGDINLEIGGIGNENIIAHNTQAGISFGSLSQTTAGTIVGVNSYFCNGTDAIDFTMTPGVDAPVITSVTASDIDGTSTASDGSTVDIYVINTGCADNQGANYVGQTTVTSGVWNYSSAIDDTDTYVATVTDVTNGISEFSTSFKTVQGFITTWSTTDNQLTIPTNGFGYNYDVVWTNLTNAGIGDGSTTGESGDYTITGLANGDIYEVVITGTFPSIYFNYSADKDKILTVEKWGDNSWTGMYLAFAGCTNLTVTATDVPDLTFVTDFRNMFDGASSFNSPINNWNVSAATQMTAMFHDAVSFNQDLDNWNIGNVFEMTDIFAGATAFNGNVSNWDVTGMTTLRRIFQNASSFNQPLNWNVSGIASFDSMFNGASSFNQDLDSWVVSGANNMSSMFLNATSFNGNIDGWVTTSLVSMPNMFSGATNFNRDIGSWSVDIVSDMRQLFFNATSFNQDISGWNVSTVSLLFNMFNGASSFNQDISGWSIGGALNFTGMFNNATSFDQNLSAWDISSATSMASMLNNCGLSTANYDATLIGWEAQTPPSGLSLGATGLTYCVGETAHMALEGAPNNWTITDAGLDCSEALTVVNTDDSGTGSLRSCITNANTIAGVNTITFNIPNTDPNYVLDGGTGNETWTIYPITDLPAITQGVVLDATTQPGTGNYKVKIDGQGTRNRGFWVNSGYAEVYGFYLTGFDAIASSAAVYILHTGGSPSTIGAVSKGNVINSNRNGISISLRGGCIIKGNLIGTDETGEIDLGNNVGISLGTSGSNQIVGGDLPGEGNLISGNNFGITANASGGHSIRGNYIGTNQDGTSALGNTDGISFGTSSNNSFINNLISGNSGSAIRLGFSTNNTIQGNIIGEGSDGSPMGNNRGIEAFNTQGVSNNTIGGISAGEGNIIVNNTNEGILFINANSVNNEIIGNTLNCNGIGIELSDLANNNIQPPVISSVTLTSVSGTGIDGNEIHVYRDNSGCTPLQGQEYLGTTTVSGGIWTVGSLTLGASDEITATATNSTDGTSEFVEYVPLAVPNDPSNLFTTEISSTQIDLSWVDNSSDETGFTIERSDDNNYNFVFLNSVGADVTTFSDNTVTPQKGYFYRIIANGGSGDSSPSNEKFGSTITPSGRSLHFDGVDDIVDLGNPDFSSFTELTVEAWVKPSYLPSGPTGETATIIGKGKTGVVGTTTFAIVLEGSGSGAELFGFIDNGSSIEVARFNGTTGFNLIEYNWIHVAMTWSDNNPVRLYVNGVEVDATANLSGPLNIVSDNMLLGSSTDINEIEYEGEVDEVRIWDVERTASEIFNNIHTTYVGNEANLFAYYRFDQGMPESNNTTPPINLLPDRSINNNNGTLNGFTLDGTTSNWVQSNALISYNIISQSPAANEIGVGLSGNILITFDDDIGAINNAVTVRSQLKGIISASIGNNDADLTIDPDVDFLSGDIITVTIGPEFQSLGGITLNRSNSYSFSTAANSGPETPNFFNSSLSTQIPISTSLPRGFKVIDIDSDGDLDVALVSSGDNKVSWYENDGSQTFTEHIIYSTAMAAIGIDAVDLDDDGDIDILVASEVDNKFAWFQNDGAENFTRIAISTGTSSNARLIQAHDIDGDGDLDLVTGSRVNPSLSWHENNGNEVFTEHTISNTAVDITDLKVIDMNGDGFLDIGAAYYNEGQLAWYENDGVQNFTEHVIVSGLGNLHTLDVNDLDDDGDLDFVAAAYTTNTVYWFKNNGSEVFTQSTIISRLCNNVTIRDLDGDLDLDILLTANELSWLENDGSENFTEYTIDTTPGQQLALAADLDMDGDLDIVSTSVNGSDKLAWYENTSPPPASNAFITTWVTTNNQIIIPTTGTGYNYDITWTNLTNSGVGDGSITGQTGNYTITGLENSSTYQIEITGTFPRIYFSGGASERNKIRTVEQWGDIVWLSMSGAFTSCTNFSITASDSPDLSLVTNMSQMFSSCTSFNSNINSWDVSNVTDFNEMFYSASAFNQPLNSWNMGNALDISDMFSFATSFNQPLNLWNVSQVTDMSYIFWQASAFNQPLNNWNVGMVTSMTGMFSGANGYNQPLDGWDVSNVTRMDQMFEGVTAFDQYLGSWNIGSVTNMSGMLNNSGLSNSNYDATLIGWASQSVNPSVTLGASGLQYCLGETARNLLTAAPNNWIISDAGLNCAFITTWITTDGQIRIPTSGTGYNYNVTWENLTNTGVGDGSTTGLTSFYDITGLENGSTYQVEITGTFPRINFGSATTAQREKIRTVEQWGDNPWTSMYRAFDQCSSLRITAIDAPDLSNVTDMREMFSGATSLNDDISFWDVSNVTDMGLLFYDASSFNQPLNAWNVSNVTNMGEMFVFATSFNQPLDLWNVGSVTNMTYMFSSATSFNQPLNAWTVHNVLDMSGMFAFTSAFNQPLNNWNVAMVSKMDWMFADNSSFNQNLGSWNIGSVTDMSNMLRNTGLSISNYDATLIGWASQSVMPNVTLGASGLQYCSGETAHLVLEGVPNNWSITDAGLLCVPEIEVFAGADNTGVAITDGQTAVIVFGTALVGNDLDQQFAIENAGGSDLNISGIVAAGTDFSIVGSVTTIAPGATANFIVRLSGATIGNFNSTVTITNDDTDESMFDFPVSGTISAIPLPEISVFVGTDNTGVELTDGQGTVIDFGSANEGTDITQAFAIENTGTVDLTITGINVSGSTFSISGASTLITAGTTTTFNVVLSGINLGTFNDVVTIASNDSDENPFTFPITGTITAVPEPEISVYLGDVTGIPIIDGQSTTIDFGSTSQNSAVSRTFTIENIGSGVLSISSITSSDAAYIVDNSVSSVAVGGIGVFTVTLISTATGTFNSTLTINNNDTDENPFTFPLTGVVTGVNIFDGPSSSANIILTNQTVSMGTTPLNVNLQKTFTIENTSSTDILTINSIVIDNPVFEVLSFTATIPPLEFILFTVQLNANTVGVYTANIEISTNINDFTFIITGEVLEVPIPELVVFNVITPNGDGVHDFLKIENIDYYPNNSVIIFNRWGDKLFEADGYNNVDNTFYGISNKGGGNELVTGNYYYAIDKGDGSKVLTGYIFIKR